MKTLRLVTANHPNYTYEVIEMNTQANDVTTTVPKTTRKAAKVVKVPAETKGPVIKLTDRKPEYKGGSARALWYGAVVKASGKSPEEFVNAATKKPPALTKEGKAEPAAGWLRYFVKEGMVELVAQK